MFPDIEALGKKAEEAQKKMAANHAETVKLLTEIRDAVRELVTVLKGA